MSSPLEDMRGKVAFLLNHIDRRDAPAYRVALHSLLEETATLLDIVEAVAKVEPVEPAVGERHDVECLHCSALGDYRVDVSISITHAPDCPYRRARELCGMEDER